MTAWVFVGAMLYGAGLLTGFSLALKIVEWDLRKPKPRRGKK